MIVEKSEYMGNPVIILKRHPRDKFPFAMGMSKARLAVEGYDEILSFIKEHDEALFQALTEDSGSGGS